MKQELNPFSTLLCKTTMAPVREPKLGLIKSFKLPKQVKQYVEERARNQDSGG